MNKFPAIVVLLVIMIPCRAQEAVLVTGRVTDSLTGEPLIGATILTGNTGGTITDIRGRYRLVVPGEPVLLTFQYLGYETFTHTVQNVRADSLELNIRLRRSVTALDEIVVSAGKYEQRLSDVMVSMDIIKPGRINSTAATSLEAVLKQTPGVEVLDGQPSIRGGSGYSYGAGSRVMVLIDGLPILTGDVGDVKWDYLPLENIQQVEIIKGASSVLYGSSALNGIINIRTRYPLEVPRTEVNLMSGIYMKPARKEMVWWDSPPYFAGGDFSHRRKIGNLDLVIGGNYFKDSGYREDDYVSRGRLDVGLKRRSTGHAGLSYGINMSGMLTDLSDFLIWRDSGSGAWRQNPLSVSALKGNRFNLDPYIEYRGKSLGLHSLKTRFFHVGNVFPEASDKDNRSGMFYGEYRYHRNFAGKIDATAGAAGTWTRSNAALYGDHDAMNQAVFAQVEGNLPAEIKATLGLRLERYVLDGKSEYSTPVFRAGLNWKILEHTFLRASMGQGYRFPSVAEKYTATNVGALRIFPNPDLVSETGWSSELGLKQGLKIGQWQGYFDLSAFLSEYHDMIEFVFDIYGNDTLPTINDYGFMARNVGNARISGIETTIYGSGTLGNFSLFLMAGYTFMHPYDPDSGEILKYRYRHSLKSDAELKYGRFGLGYTLVVNSKMERIDEVFTDPQFGNIILPGFPDYWKEKNSAYAVVDLRMLCNITKSLRAAVVVKNIMNKEYMGRPGDIQPPRNIALRLTEEF